MAEANKTTKTTKPAAKKAVAVKKPATKAVATKKPTVKKTSKQVEEVLAEKPATDVVVAQESEVIDEPEPKTTKAGKHSAKGLKEAEEKQAKEERKTHASENGEVIHTPKPVQKARSHAERAGKNYREVYKLIDRDKEYTLAQAIDLATKTSTTKFDASVELHIRLGVDPRQADQNIRGMIVLPAGTGKTVRVAVFAEADDVTIAKKAGADLAGTEDFLAKLDKGVIDFDVLVATPQVMAKLGKYARLLGPKGLMPNPKSGTVAKDVAKAVQEAKAGRVEFRVDSTGIVHLAIGKVSFGAAKLGQNAAIVTSTIKGAKPPSIKGNYVKSFFVTTSMGPSIRVAVNEL